MVVILRGIKKQKFNNDKGETVSGNRLFFEYEDEQINGVACDSKWFPDGGDIELPELQLNHKYDFVYDVSVINGKASAKLRDVKKLN